MSCKHTTLQLIPSPFAKLAGYEQPKARAAAESTSGRALKGSEDRPINLFPGPLVLPHDDLNYDPDCSPQSVKSWLHEKIRNKMLPESGRGTLYITRVPGIGKEVDYMRDWAVPRLSRDKEPAGRGNTTSPTADILADYLRAFYYGVNVTVLSEQLSWTAWEKKSRPIRGVNLPKYVGLAHDGRCTRIRVRSAPDGTFAAQLNLDDMIDAAIEMLPEDAYAICLLIDHDMYESEDDDFCCGRAYGGSRVAVIQTARYNPSLDAREGLDREHMWPISHCAQFVNGLCAVEDVPSMPPTKLQIASSKDGPMRAAVDAALESRISSLPQDSWALWISRLARTVSHEIGHCFGIAHCTYYACNMQGAASTKEDLRQPPYLCPVCEAKVGHAIAGELQGGRNKEKEMWVRHRCEALRAFCGRLEAEETTCAMWRGLDGWLMERMKGM